jgi:hypothetical protein
MSDNRQYAVKCLRQRNNKELKACATLTLDCYVNISHLAIAHRSGAERVVEAQEPLRTRATRTGTASWLSRYGLAVDGVR